MSQNITLPPLALYVHIPWCLKKCPYCDFNSHAFQGNLPEQQYTDRLLADLEHDLHYVQGRELVSIFIGGGTPSLFSPASIERLLAGIAKHLPCSTTMEVTLEANPGTFETAKFRAFRSAGINRLSIGIQSFDRDFLVKLGRVHDDKDARYAAEQVRNAGFDNFNLDLMFGLPGQNVGQARADLETALAYSPPHLSWYQLTIEPNTVFYSHRPRLPEDDLVAEMQEAGCDLLAGHGLQRYEVSAFAASGRQSRHNLNYWQFGDYLGIGAGAHGKITLSDNKQIVRTRKVRQPAGYLDTNNPFTAETTVVPAAELPLEFLMNALRLSDGVDEELFPARTGLALDCIREPLIRLRERELLCKDRLAATGNGLRYLNDVLEQFLPETNKGKRIPVHSPS
jgi:oxygen-independent coproporphyrinogen-3 oxidase